jgi:hypothetical protein
MQTCQKHGNDILVVYPEGWDQVCPFCTMSTEKEDLEGTIEELRQDKKSLEDENDSFISTIKSMETELGRLEV